VSRSAAREVGAVEGIGFDGAVADQDRDRIRHALLESGAPPGEPGRVNVSYDGAPDTP
jgi:hypothetical protein